jgi:hypothetical protein
MIRTDATSYADKGRVAVARAVAGSVDVSTPVAGFFRHRLRSGSVAAGLRIWFGAPLDPVTGEMLDRSPRWQADVNGTYFDDWNRIWPNCVGEPISEAEYRRYCAQQAWAQTNAPESAFAAPGRKIDRLSTSTPMPF